MASLQELYLNENKVTDLRDLSGLPSLRKLDLNTNKIASLVSKPDLPSLEVLDLSNNMIANGDELLNLCNYTKLRVLILTGCPYAEEQGDKLKNEILLMLGTHLKNLKTVNEEEVTEEDI
jgi:Leucine-rich repeat (LRR) protein